MVLEFIRKTESMVFDVTDSGFVAFNSGQFTYCGDLHTYVD
jgi:hypothetical protein